MNYRYYWAWERWKRSTDHEAKVKKGLNQVILNRIIHRVQHNAFTHWRRNQSILDKESKIRSRELEVENEQI